MVNITLTSTIHGSFDFVANSYDLPLISRAVEYRRISEQGPSRRKIIIGLGGFVLGNNHSDVVSKYQALLNILESNDLLMVYNDGVSDIVNTRVYVASYNEPEDWKQYDGSYSISLYYFEDHTHSVGDLGIAASFVPQGEGAYTFDPIPSISRSTQSNKGNYRENRLTPSGGVKGSIIDINLSGFLTATSNALLETEMVALESINGKYGLLNYGAFSTNCHIENVKFQEDAPRNFVNYTINAKYHTTNIVSLKSRRVFSRLHNHPKITERHYCKNRRIEIGNLSGQTVTYDIKLESDTTENARLLLGTELALIIIPGGLELEGGSEVWDDNEMSVSVNIKKFYNAPVLANIDI